MIPRAIAAALLACLVSPAIAGTAYDQAAGLAAGKSAAAAYDGNAPLPAAQAQVGGAPSAAAISASPAGRLSLKAAAVPEPRLATNFFTKRAALFGSAGAAAGTGAGFLLGGPLGAAVGALAGFGIGLLLCRILQPQ